jgi:hypothetical protein
MCTDRHVPTVPVTAAKAAHGRDDWNPIDVAVHACMEHNLFTTEYKPIRFHGVSSTVARRNPGE